MSSSRLVIISALAGVLSVGMFTLAGAGYARKAAHVPPPAPLAVVLPPVAILPAPEDAETGYYAKLRSRLRWVEARIGHDRLLTPDHESRMLLAKSAAKRAKLHEVGLDFHDVYGLINAETSWVPRMGASRNGTPNLGIAQFEPATAKALGIIDPEDPVEAVHAAALHMKEAAQWAQERLGGQRLGKRERAEKLREGVSVYYNLSSKGRAAWNGRNAGDLPVETRRHIENARLGAQQALLLEAQLKAREFADRAPLMTAGRDDGRT